MIRWSKLTVAGLLVAPALSPGLALAEWIDLGGGDPVAVQVLQDDASRTVLEITVGGFEAEPVVIDGASYYAIGLPREGRAMEPGLPELPNVRRSLIIPDDRDMLVTVLESKFVDFADMPVAPSKGHILRTVDPATVPHTFSAFYGGQGTYPATIVEHDDPYILRDHRGMVVDANVFQYDAGRRTLRVYTRLVIEITPAGPSRINVLERRQPTTTVDPQFAGLYRSHFLNAAAGTRYTPVEEAGGMLIIAYDAYASYMQPLVEWKNQKGLPTRLVTLSEVGSTYTQIFAYIQNAYQTEDLAYVLLVGDGQHVPKYGTDSDPAYALVAGSDSYPDLFIGRFSAEAPEHVQTQVARTIAYERDTPAGDPSRWLQSGTGIASNQGDGIGHFGEIDYEHMDFMRTDLLGYGYSGIDQIYDPTGTAAMVSTALNGGRSIVNYCGHGSQTSWGSTGFNTANVNALTNDGRLPFIFSVACNNGTFTNATCFAEAWLRAQHNGQPTGAIATYMSYISQSWDPPMYAEDEAVDLLVADEKRTVGGLWFNGSCEMIDATGATGATEFRNWMIFGDPSLAVRTKTAASMEASHAGVLLIGMDQYVVDLPGVPGAQCALYGDGVLYGAATADAAGHAVITMAAPPTSPMTMTLTVTAYNKATVVASIPVLPPDGPYLVFQAATVADPLGDGDGQLDYAETAGLTISLENVGVEAATGVTAVLTSADPYVSVTGGALAFANIAAGAVGSSLSACGVQISGEAPDGHVAQFSLAVTAANGVWTATFPAAIQAPVLTIENVTVDDAAGDRDGYADPGETVALTLRVANTGHSSTADLAGLVATLSPYAILVNPSGAGPGIAVGGVGDLVGFRVQITADCPVPTNLALTATVTDAAGGGAEGAFTFTVGGWFDDFETDRGWIGGILGDTATAGIWERGDPAMTTTTTGTHPQGEDDHTPAPGTLCWTTDTAGGVAGDSDVDGGRTTLLSPVFDLAGAVSASFSYWRVYTNNLGSSPGLDWWDVAVTSDGVTWISLEHTQASSTTWTQFTFDLEDFVALTDHVQVRFVADDTAPGSVVEAALDDVFLNVVRDLSTPVDDPLLQPVRLVLGENYPNPFNPKTTVHFDLPQSGRVDLAIFDLGGRKVATLVNDQLTAGHHSVSWLGQDDGGRRVASGTYVYRLQAGGEVLTRKMTLLK
jgi:hypothetical protein